MNRTFPILFGAYDMPPMARQRRLQASAAAKSRWWLTHFLEPWWFRLRLGSKRSAAPRPSWLEAEVLPEDWSGSGYLSLAHPWQRFWPLGPLPLWTFMRSGTRYASMEWSCWFACQARAWQSCRLSSHRVWAVAHLGSRDTWPAVGLDLRVVFSRPIVAWRTTAGALGTWPEGIPNIPLRAWRQVMIGSRLMRFMLDVFSLWLLPADVHLLLNIRNSLFGPCTWILPVSGLVSRCASFAPLLRVGVTSFDQCVFGCSAQKPTTIIHLCLPTLRHTILRAGHMGRCHHLAQSHEALAGRDLQGTFRTARGKVYPPGLNRALADAVVTFVQQTFVPSVQALPSDFFDLAVVGDFVSDDMVQPDFCG